MPDLDLVTTGLRQEFEEFDSGSEVYMIPLVENFSIVSVSSDNS